MRGGTAGVCGDSYRISSDCNAVNDDVYHRRCIDTVWAVSYDCRLYGIARAGGGWIDVIFGLVNIILGVLFCAYPVDSFMGIVYVFIALLLFKAIKALIFAINMARARVGH